MSIRTDTGPTARKRHCRMMIIGVALYTALLPGSAAVSGPIRLPAHIEAVIVRRVQNLERALLQRSASPLQPWLSPDVRVAGCSGEAASRVMTVALSQLRQVESLRLKTILTRVPPYRVTVSLVAYGLATDREIVLNALFRFKEINLFQVDGRTSAFGDNPLISWEPAKAPLPDAVVDHFDLAGRLMALEGITINGMTGCLILDTGTTTLTLNSRRFGPWIGQPPEAGVLAGAGGVTRRVDRVWVADFAWKEYRLTSFETIATDLASLEIRLGRPILGLLGARTLRPFELTIDYPRREVALHRLDEDGNRFPPRLGSSPGQAMPFELAGPLPVLPVMVGNTRLNLGLDSGAATMVIHESVVRRIDPGLYRGLSPCTYRGVSKNGRTARRIRLDGARVGSMVMPAMDAVVADLAHQREEFGLAIDGLLGYEFLRRQPVTINYLKRELLFRSESCPKRPD